MVGCDNILLCAILVGSVEYIAARRQASVAVQPRKEASNQGYSDMLIVAGGAFRQALS